MFVVFSLSKNRNSMVVFCFLHCFQRGQPFWKCIICRRKDNNTDFSSGFLDILCITTPGQKTKTKKKLGILANTFKIRIGLLFDLSIYLNLFISIKLAKYTLKFLLQVKFVLRNIYKNNVWKIWICICYWKQ